MRFSEKHLNRNTKRKVTQLSHGNTVILNTPSATEFVDNSNVLYKYSMVIKGDKREYLMMETNDAWPIENKYQVSQYTKKIEIHCWAGT